MNCGSEGVFRCEIRGVTSGNLIDDLGAFGKRKEGAMGFIR